jgi:D-alanine-D-alanine ligase
MIPRDLVVAILYNLGNEVSWGDPRDLIAVQESTKAAHQVGAALTKLGCRTRYIPVRSSLEELRQELCGLPCKTTFVFNLCEEFGGHSLGAARVAWMVEELGFMYTGETAGAVEMCMDKSQTKACLQARGIPTPPFQIFESGREPYRLRFPAIVKPVAEDASHGIDLESVVRDLASLYARVEYIQQRYCQPALVEEFIAGREITVSIVGNQELEFLPISEIDYSGISDPCQQIRTYESKWVESSPQFRPNPYRCPARLPASARRRVLKVAAAAYHSVGLCDYGRVDLRLWQGRPYVLELNESPDLADDASFAASAFAAGYNYPQFIERIVDVALQRCSPSPELHHRSRLAFGPASQPADQRQRLS